MFWNGILSPGAIFTSKRLAAVGIDLCKCVCDLRCSDRYSACLAETFFKRLRNKFCSLDKRKCSVFSRRSFDSNVV